MNLENASTYIITLGWKGCQDLDILETMRKLNSQCAMTVSSASSNQGIFVIVVK